MTRPSIIRAGMFCIQYLSAWSPGLFPTHRLRHAMDRGPWTVVLRSPLTPGRRRRRRRGRLSRFQPGRCLLATAHAGLLQVVRAVHATRAVHAAQAVLRRSSAFQPPAQLARSSHHTLDLQDHVAPSAKDHHPSHPHVSGTPPGAPGLSIAPHQAETLREVALETAVAEARSPSVSSVNGKADHDTSQLLRQHDADDHSAVATHDVAAGGLGIEMYHGHQQDALAIAQNGGLTPADEDDLDGDGDDLDDDLMDKISSSPSIEDAAWPRRDSSLASLPRQMEIANNPPEMVEPVAAGCVNLEQAFPAPETSVSPHSKPESVAEWQHRSDSRRQYAGSSFGRGRGQDRDEKCESLTELEVGRLNRATSQEADCPPCAIADWPGHSARLTKA
ncbi:SH3 domain containing protein [Metarhizium album ARSEF 1941]|uniref:SH3 domain containing protein n=1 Tax=Metarhizium album (strain ARSEF 1941) TaxID=1081103 RepID=A0A0B2X7B1_METAS|nr:SH3 domain containing protein [Metarhizium album ARSEF 1941]KHO01176.1 SH3 domain containing protein [Metarhizium album ARSEF 1941]